jgi:hypothetical protein
MIVIMAIYHQMVVIFWSYLKWHTIKRQKSLAPEFKRAKKYTLELKKPRKLSKQTP